MFRRLGMERKFLNVREYLLLALPHSVPAHCLSPSEMTSSSAVSIPDVDFHRHFFHHWMWPDGSIGYCWAHSHPYPEIPLRSKYGVCFLHEVFWQTGPPADSNLKPWTTNKQLPQGSRELAEVGHFWIGSHSTVQASKSQWKPCHLSGWRSRRRSLGQLRSLETKMGIPKTGREGDIPNSMHELCPSCWHKADGDLSRLLAPARQSLQLEPNRANS